MRWSSLPEFGKKATPNRRNRAEIKGETGENCVETRYEGDRRLIWAREGEGRPEFEEKRPATQMAIRASVSAIIRAIDGGEGGENGQGCLKEGYSIDCGHFWEGRRHGEVLNSGGVRRRRTSRAEVEERELARGSAAARALVGLSRAHMAEEESGRAAWVQVLQAGSG